MRRPLLLLLAASALVIVAVACGDLSNPPITRAVVFADDETEALARRACMPCHSHETEWEWYASIPGLSASLAADVAAAREKLNFSTWDREQDADIDDIAEKVLSREMPPANFLFAHPEADLSDDERRRLVDGLRATFIADPPAGDDDVEEVEDD
jgi:hypothetical protein